MPHVLTATPHGAATSLAAAPDTLLSGTYPGATTYPGADVYPGRGSDLVALTNAPRVLTETPA